MNNDVFAHDSGDLPIIFRSEAVTSVQKFVFHNNPYIILFLTRLLMLKHRESMLSSCLSLVNHRVRFTAFPLAIKYKKLNISP